MHGVINCWLQMYELQQWSGVNSFLFGHSCKLFVSRTLLCARTSLSCGKVMLGVQDLVQWAIDLLGKIEGAIDSGWCLVTLLQDWNGYHWGVDAVPSHEVRRLRGQSRPWLIQSARQPAILSSNAEGNRSWHVPTLAIASSTLAKILKGLQADGHST